GRFSAIQSTTTSVGQRGLATFWPSRSCPTPLSLRPVRSLPFPPWKADEPPRRSNMTPKTNPVLVALMALVYVVALPVILVVRLFDPLRSRLTRRGSYWERHAAVEASLKRMRRPF